MSGDAKAKTDECIQVVVRCRPLNKKENDEKRLSIIDIDIEARQVGIRNPDAPSDPPKYFTYDAAYDEKTQQKIFYDESCFNVIEGTLEGFNSTIFAYGQTGCGKSFTMQGPSTTVDELKGVIPNSFSHIFQFVKASKDMEVMIRCSYLELYNEEIKDLLSNPKQKGDKCELKEDPQKGVYVKGLTSVIAQTAEDLNAMLDRGLAARTTASTNMNAESSRSHSIFTIIVEMNTKDPQTGKDMVRVGKLNLVDLAGSERQKKTGATDAVLKEGIKINLSLSALGNVISALSEGSRHIPYRDSKLTRLLQDSLGGNTKTMMIAAISPADYNFEETMSTLRYANRAKNIKNKPKINEDPKDTMIREFKEEIERLRKLLAEKDSGGGGSALMASMLSGMLSAQSAAAEETGPSVRASDLVPERPKEQPPRHDYASPVKRTIQEHAEEDEYSPDKDHANGTGTLSNGGDLQARERALREDVASRLHQLEDMLVNHDGAMGHSLKAASSLTAQDSVSSELMLQPWAPTAEEIEEEETAARNYERRRQEARKKKDAQQAREMQRILEEKKAMEEELEELRGSRASSSGPVGGAGLQGTSASANNSANALSAAALADMEASMAKRMSRMKKKYEKRLAAAKEALEDLQEDFSYQRKQFMDAAVEQEKDVRLYELICQSVLSEKDFKRIIEKCRYDEDADEWIVPFGKKKNISDSQWQGAESSSSPRGGVGNASKMLPDINGQGKGGGGGGGGNNGGNFSQQALSTLRDPSKINGKNGGGSVDYEGNVRQSPVPLLTLPGNLVTPASLMSPAGPYSNINNNAQKNNDSKGGFHLPQISGRSDAQSARVGAGADNAYDYRSSGSTGGAPSFNQAQILPQQPVEKKKKSKAKNPKTHAGGIGYSSARSQGDGEYVDYTDNDASGSSAQYTVETKGGEEGAGETAGPLEDWGFAYEGGAALPVLNGRGEIVGPELEYSDDEDFESTEDIISGSQYKQGMVHGDGPYPPAYGNGAQKPRKGGKKKKKAQQQGYSDEPSGGKSSFALPPI